MNCDIELYAGLSQVQSKLHTQAFRLTEVEKRLAALETDLQDLREDLQDEPSISIPTPKAGERVEFAFNADGSLAHVALCGDQADERLAQIPASSMPDAIEQTEVEPQWGCDVADAQQTTCHLGLAHCHRAEAAEAEVQRLTAEVDALKTACQRIQADLDGSLGLVIDRAEIQPHLDALDDARPGWWLS